ncbi:type IV toxin-antitoxin system AbiEi family antitoxin domain-containing protein [bacterium]|nr:type IV toxin-antitoxin system AbiEi family antitoxin domain-containing protein [bacterium]NUN44645.1 type IV toxin-antitoxin system AbiEi family antitoxin domain-containing protein [bacterium]
MKSLKDAGIHPRTVSRAVQDGIIEKIKPGLYRLPEKKPDAHSSYYVIHWAIPSAIIALTSAAVYHELTTANPSEIFIAVPQNKSKIRLDYPPVRIFYFPETYYKTGMVSVKTPRGRFRIYTPEKTICDLFRYRRKLGESIAIEALRTYASRRSRDLNKLMTFARRCKVEKIISPILKGLIG